MVPRPSRRPQGKATDPERRPRAQGRRLSDLPHRRQPDPSSLARQGRHRKEDPRQTHCPHNRPPCRAWFTQRLPPAGEPAPNPKGVARIGAAADPEILSVKMFGSLRSTARDGLALSRAEIKGRLTVTAPEALVSALSDGIGRARAYGCGLLLVR
ncbi:type I-E CRISPR-associated protein Cas6/Cse3/CasE [Streptomyces galilaeus]|uniref:type I-E CRISPR-associated protein Cas6/Cse3/CasE n=1 Tax=Streptomyces galilaeus TaxID=33899 RepID=UPI0038F7AFE4